MSRKKTKEKFKKSKILKTTGIVIIGLIIVLLLPIFIAFGVTWKIPLLERVVISNDWIGFWASYIGTLVGIGIPIILFLRQRKEDRKQSVIPVLDAYQENGLRQIKKEFACNIDYIWKEGKFYIYILADERHKELEKQVKGECYFHAELIIRNIGVGPTMDLNVYMEKGEKEPNSSISIAPGESAKYNLYIPRKKVVENDNKLIFEFKDIYQNQYKQSVTFGTMEEENRVILTNFSPISKIEEI